MPKKIHNQLVKQARKKGLTGKRLNAYVYGTLNKIEREPKNGSLKTRRKKDY